MSSPGPLGHRVDDRRLAIHAMQASEVETVAQLHHDAWHETQAPLQDPQIAKARGLSFFTNYAAERWPSTLVAEIDGKLAGFASWTDAHFNSLFLAPTFRSSGSGTALLAAAETAMEKSSSRPFGLFCLYGNDDARRFYERHGWRVDHIADRPAETLGGTAFVKTLVMQK